MAVESDVAALGVADDGDVIRDVLQGALKGLQAGNAQGFVEGHVGLVAADLVRGGVYDGLVELQHVIDGHEGRIGVQSHAHQRLVLTGGCGQLFLEG